MATAAADDGLALRRTPIVEAVEKVHAAVVNISTERVVLRRSLDGYWGPGGDLFDQMFEDFFGRRRPGGVVERKRVQQPLGSGCIITPDGLVVTNEHVVRRASNIQLSLDTGETYEAELLAADAEHDVALLRAKTDEELPTIRMGASSDLMLGETVVAVGNPFGFENSVTTGIISAFGREIEVESGRDALKYDGLIQTSALINPGNSGGALVNVLGELIGINTAVVDHAQGIGFAIPIDRVRETLAPLLASRRVTRAWPGLNGETAPAGGVRVTGIDPEGPAAAVLEEGDLLLALEDMPIRDLFDLMLGVSQRAPGDRVSLLARRNEATRRVELTLAERPKLSWAGMVEARCGLRCQDVTPDLAGNLRLRVREGVLITEVLGGGPAGGSGLQPGDVIIQIGAQAVHNLREAAEALAQLASGRQVLVVVVRGNIKGYTRIRLGSRPT